jgi:hypothetical protein
MPYQYAQFNEFRLHRLGVPRYGKILNMSNRRSDFAAGILAVVLISTAAPSPAPNGAVAGLLMTLSGDDAAKGPDKAMQFIVSFRDTTSEEMTVTPGTTYNCGHEASKTSLVRISLTDASGVPHRHLEFLGSGLPAVSTPWGTLNALNLNTGRYVWQIPFGEYPELNDPTTGSENYGGESSRKAASFSSLQLFTTTRSARSTS